MPSIPIFVVGVPRSGTTLLAAMLASHSLISCGPETHFFRWLLQSESNHIDDPGSWPEAAVDFISSITFTNYVTNEKISLLDKYNLESDQIAQYLASKQPTIPDILSSITEQYMTRSGKRRWVEKTPDHIKYVNQIRSWFPKSPIIRIIRDPRDVALSLTQLPWGAKTTAQGLLFWKQLDEQSKDFFSSDTLSYTLRYEDLISNPVNVLTDLCQFIGEEFEETMLDTSRVGTNLNSMKVPWKDMASKPIDSSRIALWRNEFTKEENRLAEALVGDRIEAYDYPRETKFCCLGEILPTINLSIKYANAFSSKQLAEVRFWKNSKDENSSVKVYLGDPNFDGWFTYKKAQRVVNTFLILVDVIRSIVSKKSIYWFTFEKYDRDWPGYSVFFLKKFLAPYKVTL